MDPDRKLAVDGLPRVRPAIDINKETTPAARPTLHGSHSKKDSMRAPWVMGADARVALAAARIACSAASCAHALRRRRNNREVIAVSLSSTNGGLEPRFVCFGNGRDAVEPRFARRVLALILGVSCCLSPFGSSTVEVVRSADGTSSDRNDWVRSLPASYFEIQLSQQVNVNLVVSLHKFPAGVVPTHAALPQAKPCVLDFAAYV